MISKVTKVVIGKVIKGNPAVKKIDRLVTDILCSMENRQEVVETAIDSLIRYRLPADSTTDRGRGDPEACLEILIDAGFSVSHVSGVNLYGNSTFNVRDVLKDKNLYTYIKCYLFIVHLITFF